VSKKVTFDQYLGEKLDADEISAYEKEIIARWIGRRKSTKNTSHATQKKQAYNAVAICQILHENGAALDTCHGGDLYQVVEDITESCTQNSRQTKITILKGIAKYIDQWHHQIPDLSRQLDDVKAGSAERNVKEILSLEEWDTVLNTPMSAKDRAMIALMYDGYHRPKEILILKWSDLKVTKKGIEYRITFKTKKPRTILQKKETTAILELWRQELGAKYGEDPRPIFPDKNGLQYKSTTPVRDLVDDLREKTGLKMSPSSFRNTGITHDVEAGLPTSYICLRAWGDTYNELINIYADPSSSRFQADIQGREEVSVETALKRRKIAAVVICPSCEAVNAPGAQYCNDCGAGLTKEAVMLLAATKGSLAENQSISQEKFNEMLAIAQKQGKA